MRNVHEEVRQSVIGILDLKLEGLPHNVSIVFAQLISAFMESLDFEANPSMVESFEEQAILLKSHYSQTDWSIFIDAVIPLLFELYRLEEKDKSDNSLEIKSLIYIFELKVADFLIGHKDQIIEFVEKNKFEYSFVNKAAIGDIVFFLEKAKEFYKILNEVIASPKNITLDPDLFSLASSFREEIPLFIVDGLAAMFLATKSAITPGSFLAISANKSVSKDGYFSMSSLLGLVVGGFDSYAITKQLEAHESDEGSILDIDFRYLRDMLKHRNKNFEMNRDFFTRILDALNIPDETLKKISQLSMEVVSIALKMLPNPESFDEKEAILLSLFQHLNALNFGKDELCKVLQRCINICCKKVTDKEAIKAMAKIGAFGEDIGEKDVQKLLDNMYSSEANILILTGIFSKTNNESPLRVFRDSEYALIPKMLGYE